MEVKAGQVVLIDFPFIDNSSSKVRPAFVLFSDFENVVVIGITSNLKMSGILLTKKDGLYKDSILKLNYILINVLFLDKLHRAFFPLLWN